MDQRGCICVFAKPPVAGRVKTRLIPRLGSSDAAELATRFFQDTIASVSELSWAETVIASTDESITSFLPAPMKIWLQGEGNLGARLEAVVHEALREHPYAIALGADSPGLPIKFLEEAREALTHSDAVVGPSEDGGFYLLGLRRCPVDLLSGIPWSTKTTCEGTIAKLKAAGLTVHILPSWFDVDTADELAKLRSLLSAKVIHAPRTKQFLETRAPAYAVAPPIHCSVIIPTLNERATLPKTLSLLQKQKWVHEVIVADGGSTDGTREWLNAQNFARVVDAPAGKGNQINAGVQAATGDVLLFLHADCQLPPDGLQHIASALGSPEIAGGCFEVSFTSNHAISLELVARGINFRTRLSHSATGDQGIFVRKQVFDLAGGCPNWPLFEDVELVRRIKELGKFAVLRSRLRVSARRHLSRGVFRTVLLVYLLRVAFWFGASPFTLKRWFDDFRPDTQKIPDVQTTAERPS